MERTIVLPAKQLLKMRSQWVGGKDSDSPPHLLLNAERFQTKPLTAKQALIAKLQQLS